MHLKLKRLPIILFNSFVDVINHDGIEHAGYLSFLVLFSIFPFIIFFFILSSISGYTDLGVSFIASAIEAIPGDIIQIRVKEIMKLPPHRLMTLAIIGGVWTASSFVEALRTILNRIYKIHTPPHYIFRRTLSIIQFILIVFVLFIGMMILVIMPIIFNNLFNISMSVNHELSISFLHYINKLNFIWQYIKNFSVYMFLFLSSSALYYFIPNTKIKFKNVLPGAALAVLLWYISGHFFSKYISYYSQLDLVYGSLANIIITMIFFYINNIIFIYGAEFNYHISKG